MTLTYYDSIDSIIYIIVLSSSMTLKNYDCNTRYLDLNPMRSSNYIWFTYIFFLKYFSKLILIESFFFFLCFDLFNIQNMSKKNISS